MSRLKDLDTGLKDIIEDLRSRGLTDNHIMQLFQLVLEGPPKPKVRPLLSVNVEVHGGLDNVRIEGDPDYLVHAIAALIIAYTNRSDNTCYGDSLDDIIVELKGLGIKEIRRCSPCQDNTRS